MYGSGAFYGPFRNTVVTSHRFHCMRVDPRYHGANSNTHRYFERGEAAVMGYPVAHPAAPGRIYRSYRRVLEAPFHLSQMSGYDPSTISLIAESSTPLRHAVMGYSQKLQAPESVENADRQLCQAHIAQIPLGRSVERNRRWKSRTFHPFLMLHFCPENGHAQ